MKSVHSEKAPAAVGPYSQAIEANGFVFASGQLPIDPSTGKFPEGGIKEQTRQSILNAQEVLKAAGLDLSNVIKTTVYLSRVHRSESIKVNCNGFSRICALHLCHSVKFRCNSKIFQ